jgi:hypothetical protein
MKFFHEKETKDKKSASGFLLRTSHEQVECNTVRSNHDNQDDQKVRQRHNILCHDLHREEQTLKTLQPAGNVFFVSTFPLSVRSLSWQMIGGVSV